jgi:hypothetical protein
MDLQEDAAGQACPSPAPLEVDPSWHIACSSMNRIRMILTIRTPIASPRLAGTQTATSCPIAPSWQSPPCLVAYLSTRRHKRDTLRR